MDIKGVRVCGMCMHTRTCWAWIVERKEDVDSEQSKGVGLWQQEKGTLRAKLFPFYSGRALRVKCSGFETWLRFRKKTGLFSCTTQDSDLVCLG